MKKVTLIAVLTAVMIMMSAFAGFADDGLQLVASYPEDGQNNTSMENLGVKLTFNHPINSKEAKEIDTPLFRILDEDGKEIPIMVLFSDKNDGLVLVLADIDEGFQAKNNSEYKLVIGADVIDNEGNTLGADKTITFRTYNQRVNNMVNMAMMFIMFGGITVLTVRQNNNKKEEEEIEKEETNKEAFNPYKEAKRTGKTVEEVMAEQAKKEEKLAKKRAKKNKGKEAPQEKKIDNCAQYLNNVYHVHAPAPISKEDRSIDALRSMRKAEARAAKAEARAEKAEREAKAAKKKK
jgi:hypothetical protein